MNISTPESTIAVIVLKLLISLSGEEINGNTQQPSLSSGIFFFIWWWLFCVSHLCNISSYTRLPLLWSCFCQPYFHQVFFCFDVLQIKFLLPIQGETTEFRGNIALSRTQTKIKLNKNTANNVLKALWLMLILWSIFLPQGRSLS